MVQMTEHTTAFPRLNEAQLACVSTIGDPLTFEDGEYLISAGVKDFPLYVVKSGEVEILESSSGSPKTVVIHQSGEFTGDVDMLTGRPSLISAVARGKCQVYRLCAKRVRQLMGEITELSDMLLDAFQARRLLLEQSGFIGIRVIGHPLSKETMALREFFYKNHVPHTLVDVTEPEGQRTLTEMEIADDETPVVACHETVSKRPPLAKVAECLGISRAIDTHPYDLVIVGAGPSGISAAVYASSEGLRTLVIDRVGPGGQAASSSKIENFMGFPSGISGADLANRGYLQALKFGTSFTAPVSVQGMACGNDGIHRLALCTGQTALAKSVLISTGVSYRQLDLPGCAALEGSGIYYSATSVEGRICRDGTAIVVGGGNSAGQAAMFLAEHSPSVKLLIRSGDLSKSMSAYLARRIQGHEKIEVLPYREITKVIGRSSLEAVEIRNNQTGNEEMLQCRGLFIFIGAKPHTDWLPEAIRLDQKGYVLTGAAAQADSLWPLDRPPCDLETTCPGVMAAGDVRAGTTKRCGFAVGDGSLAVACVHRFLSFG